MKHLVMAMAATAGMALCSQAFAAGKLPGVASPAALGGVLGNGQATLTAILSDLPGTVQNLLASGPTALANGITAGSNALQAVPGILTGSSIDSTSETASLNLPGPGLLPGSTTLLDIPNQLSVSMINGPGADGLTITTGK